MSLLSTPEIKMHTIIRITRTTTVEISDDPSQVEPDQATIVDRSQRDSVTETGYVFWPVLHLILQMIAIVLPFLSCF